jgi:hypothetical protein
MTTTNSSSEGKKIVFLDIDGVLNSERSFVGGAYREREYEKHFKDGTIDDPYWLKITRCTIDPIACDLVNRVLRECDAYIVMSSTHRQHFPEDENKLKNLQDYLTGLGVDGHRLIGWTPRLHTPRGIEIKYWLDKNPGWDRFVIVDDDSDMLPEQMEYFVRTDNALGVTIDTYRKMRQILNCADPAYIDSGIILP